MQDGKMIWRCVQGGLLSMAVAMLGYALYVQYSAWLMPCVMCVWQRLGVAVVAVLALAGLLWAPRRRWEVVLMVVLQGGALLITSAVAIRHASMQYGADTAPGACPSSLPFPLNFDHPNMPAWVAMVFRPVGNCDKIDAALLGVSMPVWVAALLMGMSLILIGAAWQRWRCIQ